MASQDIAPSNIETSTTCPSPERSRSRRAARIPTAAGSAPPPRSAIWAAAWTGGRLDPLVIGRRPADVVAQAGVLDLEHVGAEVGQQERAEATREQPGQVEDADAGQRARGHRAPSAASIGCVSRSRRLTCGEG